MIFSTAAIASLFLSLIIFFRYFRYDAASLCFRHCLFFAFDAAASAFSPATTLLRRLFSLNDDYCYAIILIFSPAYISLITLFILLLPCFRHYLHYLLLLLFYSITAPRCRDAVMLIDYYFDTPFAAVDADTCRFTLALFLYLHAAFAMLPPYGPPPARLFRRR